MWNLGLSKLGFRGRGVARMEKLTEGEGPAKVAVDVVVMVMRKMWMIVMVVV